MTSREDYPYTDEWYAVRGMKKPEKVRELPKRDSSPDKPDPFLIWLDEQIETNENLADREDHKMESNLSYRGQQYALEAAKEKYLSLNKQDTK